MAQPTTAQDHNGELAQAIGDIDGPKHARNAAYRKIGKILDATPWADAMADHVPLLQRHGMTQREARATVLGWLAN